MVSIVSAVYQVDMRVIQHARPASGRRTADSSISSPGPVSPAPTSAVLY